MKLSQKYQYFYCKKKKCLPKIVGMEVKWLLWLLCNDCCLLLGVGGLKIISIINPSIHKHNHYHSNIKYLTIVEIMQFLCGV